MPGAGSIVASNYIYNVAPQDGLVLGLMNNAAAFERLLGVEETKFDSRKINWLGSPTQDTAVVMVWHTVPVASLDDAKARKSHSVPRASTVRKVSTFGFSMMFSKRNSG